MNQTARGKSVLKQRRRELVTRVAAHLRLWLQEGWLRVRAEGGDDLQETEEVFTSWQDG